MSESNVFNELRKITGKLTQEQVDAGNLIISKLGLNTLLKLTGLDNMILTQEQLKKIYPGANVEFVDAINTLTAKYQITTKERLAMFLAQTLHETGGYTKLRESLAYSASRLLEVFPSRVKTLSNANAIVAKGQVGIGDAIYGGRYGNGINNGDGYKYRGGGCMHTTFKDNYSTASKALNNPKIDLVKNPELIATPEVAVETAMIYWRDNKLNTYADKKDISGATKVINGGNNGLKERKALYDKALAVL